MTERLASRADFEAFQSQANQNWADLWGGDKLVVSVCVDSGSTPKGAERILALLQGMLGDTNAVVRQVSGTGAMDAAIRLPNEKLVATSAARAIMATWARRTGSGGANCAPRAAEFITSGCNWDNRVYSAAFTAIGLFGWVVQLA